MLTQIDSARQTMSGPIPPPLIGSPKCVRCSLNSICLPDETRLLAVGGGESLELRVERNEGSRQPGSGLSTERIQLERKLGEVMKFDEDQVLSALKRQ
ncbi:MAG: hypothetical protein WBV90_01065 [Terrimicrobiaceae bacterium]